MSEADFMHLAIAKAKEGIALGQSPFGAVVVQGTRIVAGAHNTVWLTTDPTAHAEVNAIRLAARELETIALRGCTMFTTCEPCPMCLAAIHWAKLDRVVYGASIADAAAAGFSELHLPAGELAERGRSHLQVHGGVCQPECAALFQLWRAAKGKTY
jgi:tRNA(Arg) A34 adenosine deaminase TadA